MVTDEEKSAVLILEDSTSTMEVAEKKTGKFRYDKEVAEENPSNE